MSDHWLYIQELPPEATDWSVEGDQAWHAHVKRLATNEPIHLFNGRGRVAAARVLTWQKRILRLRIEDIYTVSPRRPRLAVAVSQPKGERLDWMLEKLTELGVAAIWPLECDRSVARAAPQRLDRWHRRVIEAAKQAHVAWLPLMEPSRTLPQLLDQAGQFTQVYAADTVGATISAVSAGIGPDDRPLILIGPEGGFSDLERARMDQGGVQRLSLGTTILRTETAAIVAAACLLAIGDPTARPVSAPEAIP